jgi:hypothetical protein
MGPRHRIVGAMRLIHALWVEIETPSPASRALVVWLDSYGNPTAPFIWAAKRIVDLGPGDEIRHKGKRYKVAGVKPFLEHTNVSAEFLRERSIPDGFVVA